MEENRVRPSIIMGTSSGSIAATLYGSGYLYSLEQFSSLLPWDQILKWEKLTRFTGLPLGLLKSNAVERLLKKILGDKKLSQLKPLIGVVATDLATGETVVYASWEPLGKLPPQVVAGGDQPAWQAVRASISVPGLFVPYQIGHRWLGDGGVTDNVPAHLCRLWGAERVIAVDLGCPSKPKNFRHLAEVLWQCYEIASRRNVAFAHEYADLVLRPIKRPVSSWDFSAFSEMVQAGREEAQNQLENIKKLIQGKAG